MAASELPEGTEPSCAGLVRSDQSLMVRRRVEKSAVRVVPEELEHSRTDSLGPFEDAPGGTSLRRDRRTRARAPRSRRGRRAPWLRRSCRNEADGLPTTGGLGTNAAQFSASCRYTGFPVTRSASTQAESMRPFHAASDLLVTKRLDATARGRLKRSRARCREQLGGSLRAFAEHLRRLLFAQRHVEDVAVLEVADVGHVVNSAEDLPHLVAEQSEVTSARSQRKYFPSSPSLSASCVEKNPPSGETISRLDVASTSSATRERISRHSRATCRAATAPIERCRRASSRSAAASQRSSTE